MESAIPNLNASQPPSGDFRQTRDCRNGRGGGVRHLPAREESRDMKRDVRRDGCDKIGNGLHVGIRVVSPRHDERRHLDVTPRRVRPANRNVFGTVP